MVNAVFRRSERRAKTFSCNFRVAIGGSEIIIPAVTFVPEEFLCVFVDVHNEDPSLSERQTLLSEVPYDIMYQMCRKLDIPARERGQWRDVGRHFGVSEVDLQSCCREYASLDGSPSRALMEIISFQRPKLTVGELIKFLEEHGRGDVVSVLSKVKD
ncbi:uncharacterized protein LOC110234001 [Exaiptasia diaphana]|uniref:Death domain-containing protein n=1 Tax=Exaiptasia diaphana TaxID=2652724 RepID=A0A913WW35_EXADI|nr:uncharacterized protein LOC110234001 [Exaiptasia diaphana]